MIDIIENLISMSLRLNKFNPLLQSIWNTGSKPEQQTKPLYRETTHTVTIVSPQNSQCSRFSFSFTRMKYKLLGAVRFNSKTYTSQ